MPGSTAPAADASHRHLVDGDSRAGPGREVDSRLRARRRGRVHRGGAAVPIGESCSSESSTRCIGTRHERERKKIQPIVDEINEHYARLQERLRRRASRADGEVPRDHPRAHRRARGAGRRRSRNRSARASDPAERDRIDTELSGADGRGGAEGELREEIADVLDEILPEAFATVREGGAAPRRHDGHGDRPRAGVGHGALRRAAHGRHPAAPRARSPKWRPAKARRSSRRCRSISTRCPARARTS